MMASVLGLDGKKVGDVELPPQFDEPVRPDLARRAFHAEATLFLQPHGAFALAGQRTSADYFGRRHRSRQSINTGRSRLPREKLAGLRLGRVRIVPHSVKGRRAHPPKAEKKLVEKINLKEKRKAIRGSIAASAKKDFVQKRGHALGAAVVPIVVDSSLESLKKSREVKKALEQIGLGNDLQRAVTGRKKRGGRKGGYRTPKSVLIVYAKDGGIAKAGRSLPGVDVIRVDELTASALAPGGVPGRLVVWTKDALQELSSKKLFE